ncbi:cupin domain-containing protein [Dongshaea marina]|uniref:cupin domain-containing protein n=1 Tax=Dongshaea marina TaxID=2047966 RepID=UPI000D3E0BF7|nr:cupin domain-containing protein [Dongshaea marina]
MDIGYKLKHLRQKAQLSQRELAKRAGVTNGFISQLENNQLSPSIASLKKVLDGFPISLADFFTENDETSANVVFRASEMPDLGSGDIQYLLVGHGKTPRAIGMLKEVMQPGADTGPEMLTHGGEECGIVIEGCLELSVDQESYRLDPGDGYYFDSRRPHRFRNIGSDVCVLISANTPPSF